LKTIKIIGITILFIALTYFGYVKVSRFFAIDSCLDRGGRWNYKTNQCELDSNLLVQGITSSNWTFDKIEGSKLVFKNGQKFETNLFELEFIGQVPADNKAPYFIFSGRDCNECDANISIYIHSPSDGQLNVGHGQNRYQYPGTETDYQSDKILYVSRAFYGKVLENINGIIWYENRLSENGKMGRTVYLSYIVNNLLKDTVYEDKGKLGETVNLSKKGFCKEIKGRQYTSEP
jgi:hypothetical protein